jgi:hypothetical protein
MLTPICTRHKVCRSQAIPQYTIGASVLTSRRLLVVTSYTATQYLHSTRLTRGGGHLEPERTLEAACGFCEPLRQLTEVSGIRRVGHLWDSWRQSLEGLPWRRRGTFHIIPATSSATAPPPSQIPHTGAV